MLRPCLVGEVNLDNKVSISDSIPVFGHLSNMRTKFHAYYKTQLLKSVEEKKNPHFRTFKFPSNMSWIFIPILKSLTREPNRVLKIGGFYFVCVLSIKALPS